MGVNLEALLYREPLTTQKAYRERLKQKDIWKYKLGSGEIHMFLGTRMGGLASWKVCEQWRINRNDNRLCFDSLSLKDQIEYAKQAYSLVKTFPLLWKEYWISFLMLFDKYVLKDWEEELWDEEENNRVKWTTK